MLLIVLVVRARSAGASRWIALGPLRIQPAELQAVFVLLPRELSVVRRLMRCEITCADFLKAPMGVILVLAVLLLARPDLRDGGRCLTTLAMLFSRRGDMAVHRHYPEWASRR